MTNKVPIVFACLGILVLVMSTFAGRSLEGMNVLLSDLGAEPIVTKFEIAFYHAVLVLASATVLLLSVAWVVVGPAFRPRKRIESDFVCFLATEDDLSECTWFLWTWTVVTLVLLFALVATLNGTHEYYGQGVGWFDWLILEGGFWETLTAFCLIVSGGLVFLSGLKHGPTHTWLRLPNLALGLLFVIAAGEELSWGQHWLEFSTPEYLARLNRKDEFNLHNVDGHFANHLATIFFLVYLIMLPITSFISPHTRYVIDKLALPLAPLAFVPFAIVGVSMVDHAALENLWGNPPDFLGEARESLFGIITLGVSIRFLLQRRTASARVTANGA